MAIVKKETSRTRPDAMDSIFGHWTDLLRRPVMLWPTLTDDIIRVEEYVDGKTLVVKAEVPGVDPERDIDVSVTDGVLHIQAERREEEKREDRDFYRHELRYGSVSRDLPLPEGTTEADVVAKYTDGILEIRVPLPEQSNKGGTTKVKVLTK